MSATNIFVNISTTDLDRSKAFYTSLGYTINPQFSPLQVPVAKQALTELGSTS